MKRLFLVISGLLLAVSAFSQTDLQPAATINLTKNEAITVRQWRTEVERMEKAFITAVGRSFTDKDRRDVLDTMINERLVMQAAERDRISVTENEVNQQLQQLRGQLDQQLGRPATDAEYSLAIKNQYDMDQQAFKEQLRRQLIMQKYLMSKKGTLINSIKAPTDEEIVSQFNLNRKEFFRPDTIRFTMIQVPYGPDAASRVKAKELADRLVAEIGSNPSKFNDVVNRSLAPNSGYQAGDAGYLPRNEAAQSYVGDQFINTAFSLTEGQVSRLIDGAAGYQIIKVTEHHSMKNLELDDIAQLGTRITVREYIRQVLLNQRQQTILNQATEELVAELRAGKTFQVFDRNLVW